MARARSRVGDRGPHDPPTLGRVEACGSMARSRDVGSMRSLPQRRRGCVDSRLCRPRPRWTRDRSSSTRVMENCVRETDVSLALCTSHSAFLSGASIRRQGIRARHLPDAKTSSSSSATKAIPRASLLSAFTSSVSRTRPMSSAALSHGPRRIFRSSQQIHRAIRRRRRPPNRPKAGRTSNDSSNARHQNDVVARELPTVDQAAHDANCLFARGRKPRLHGGTVELHH